MSSPYLQPGPWMSRKDWDYDATEKAIRNFLGEDKNYPYLQLNKENKKYLLRALNTQDVLSLQKSSIDFKKKFASVDLIKDVAKSLFKLGRMDDLKTKFEEYIRPHEEMRRQLAQKQCVRRSLAKELDLSEALSGCGSCSVEPTKTRPIFFEGSSQILRSNAQQMEEICKLISKLSLDFDLHRERFPEDALQTYHIGSSLAGGPSSAFKKVTRALNK